MLRHLNASSVCSPPVDGRRVVVAYDGEHGHPGEVFSDQCGDSAGGREHLLAGRAPVVVGRVIPRPHDVLRILRKRRGSSNAVSTGISKLQLD